MLIVCYICYTIVKLISLKFIISSSYMWLYSQLAISSFLPTVCQINSEFLEINSGPMISLQSTFYQNLSVWSTGRCVRNCPNCLKCARHLFHYCKIFIYNRDFLHLTGKRKIISWQKLRKVCVSIKWSIRQNLHQLTAISNWFNYMKQTVIN